MNHSIESFDLLVITGPTASGKTALAAAVAERLGGEIISADSRQVYRGMDIGTGKDYADYLVNGKKIPFHLIDIAPAGYKYNVFEFQRDFIRVYKDLKSRNVFPVVCGGSGLYIDSIVSGYRLLEVPPDEELRKELGSKSLDELTTVLNSMKRMHNTTDVDSVKRAIRAIEIEKYYASLEPGMSEFPVLRTLVTGVGLPRETRRRRITERLKDRLGNGLIGEVKALLDSGLSPEQLIYYGLEYKYITLYLTGSLSYDEMFSQLETAIHQFAKRQMTWFRGMERKGVCIHWIDGELPAEKKINEITGLLERGK